MTNAINEYGQKLERLGQMLRDQESSLADIVDAAMDCGLELQFRLVKRPSDGALKETVEQDPDTMEYCVVRTYSAGVHIGYVKRHEGQMVELVKARRLWSWRNAASLSQVAMDGCDSDKFAMEVPRIVLTDAIEIIPCTKKAQERLQRIPEWKC